MESLFMETGEILVSTLGAVELLSNLKRVHLVDGAIDKQRFAEIWVAFSMALATGRIRTVAISAEIMSEAIRVLQARYMTPMDALQVAATMSLGTETVVVSSDRKLNGVVTELGMRCLDPTEEGVSS